MNQKDVALCKFQAVIGCGVFKDGLKYKSGQSEESQLEESTGFPVAVYIL